LLQSQEEPFGRLAFILTKSSNQYYGEIITIRDTLLLLSTISVQSNSELLENIDSLVIIQLSNIEYVKLAEIVHKQAWKSGLIGGLLGSCYSAISYFSKEKEKRNLLQSSIGIPIGFLVGYFWGLSVDVRKSAPIEIYFPDEKGLYDLIYDSRFSKGEPIHIQRAIDYQIFKYHEKR